MLPFPCQQPKPLFVVLYTLSSPPLGPQELVFASPSQSHSRASQNRVRLSRHPSASASRSINLRSPQQDTAQPRSFSRSSRMSASPALSLSVNKKRASASASLSVVRAALSRDALAAPASAATSTLTSPHSQSVSRHSAHTHATATSQKETTLSAANTTTTGTGSTHAATTAPSSAAHSRAQSLRSSTPRIDEHDESEATSGATNVELEMSQRSVQPHEPAATPAPGGHYVEETHQAVMTGSPSVQSRKTRRTSYSSCGYRQRAGSVEFVEIWYV